MKLGTHIGHSRGEISITRAAILCLLTLTLLLLHSQVQEIRIRDVGNGGARLTGMTVIPADRGALQARTRLLHKRPPLWSARP